MYKVVQATLNSHPEAWSGIPKFAEMVTRLDNRIAQVELMMQNQAFSGKPITQEKNLRANELVNRLFTLTVIARSYAIEIGDTLLESRMTVRKTDLRRGDVKARLDRMNLLLEQVQPHLENLIEFGLSVEMVEEVMALRDDFASKISAPRMHIIARSQMRSNINQTVRQIDLLISVKIASMVALVEQTHPDFAGKFNRSRVVIDLRNRTNRPPTPPTDEELET
jgi:hypothetical protein